MLKSKVIAGLVTAFCFVAPGQATTVSYLLDQSNKLADGIPYLQVTISDEGAPGAIDFTVVALQPLLDLAGENFGIRKFGFNVLGGVGAEARDVTALPESWRARNGGRMDGFGLFDITLRAFGKDYYNDRDEKNEGKPKWKHGANVQDPLTFSITGVDLDTVLSYVDLSTGGAAQGFSFFSAQVYGLDVGKCGGSGGGKDDDKKSGSTYSDSDGKPGGGHGGGNGGTCVKSAYFGGNTSAVPAPPAVWLLGTGLVGLLARRFRSAKAAS